MVHVKYNEPCEQCGGQLWIPINSYRLQDDADEWADGNVHEDRTGFVCLECLLSNLDADVPVQLTREIPESHASDDSLDLPDSADRDMVREDDQNT